MLHGRVVRPPAVGATLVSVDESSVKDLPGVVKVVVRKNFVGVVAEKPWQAIQAAEKLKVTWTPGTGLPKQSDFYESLRKQPTRDTMLVDSKDIAQTLAKAATVLKATYYHPYQMHGSMGSSCAVADVQGDKATICSPTQGVWYQKTTGAMILGLKPENVHVIFRRGSGCYGLNGADTVSYDALILSQAVGKPVRVQLTPQRRNGVGELRQRLGDRRARRPRRAGQHHRVGARIVVAGAGQSARPGDSGQRDHRDAGGLFSPRRSRRARRGSPARYSNNSNGVPSYVAGRVGGVTSGGTGTVKSEKRARAQRASPFWTGPLRSPARLQNTFAHESFMDELAARVKADPVEYRLRHLAATRA